MFKILTNIDMMPALNFGENTMLFCTFNSEGVKNNIDNCHNVLMKQYRPDKYCILI